MILTAEPVDASHALAMGLLDVVVTGADPLEEAMGWAEPVSRRDRAALTAAKRSLLNAQRLPLGTGLQVEQDMFMHLLTGEKE